LHANLDGLGPPPANADAIVAGVTGLKEEIKQLLREQCGTQH
jgi:hypothetical protein